MMANVVPYKCQVTFTISGACLEDMYIKQFIPVTLMRDHFYNHIFEEQLTFRNTLELLINILLSLTINPSIPSMYVDRTMYYR